MKKIGNIITSAIGEGASTALSCAVDTVVIGGPVALGISVGTKIAKGKWDLKKHAIDTAKTCAIIGASFVATSMALSVTEDICNNIVELATTPSNDNIEDPWADEEVAES